MRSHKKMKLVISKIICKQIGKRLKATLKASTKYFKERRFYKKFIFNIA